MFLPARSPAMLIVRVTFLAVSALFVIVPLTRTLLAAALLLRSCSSRAVGELAVPVALVALEELLGGALTDGVLDEQALRASVTAAARARYDARRCLAKLIAHTSRE
jgi:hypothetical protein